MNKIYNRLREDLDHRYSEKILWERDTKRKVELVKQRELLRDDKELLKEKILYCFMNNNFEFVDEQGNITDEIEEAAGYESLDKAIDERDGFDEPEEWKIIKKKVIFVLEEIVDE